MSWTVCMSWCSFTSSISLVSVNIIHQFDFTSQCEHHSPVRVHYSVWTSFTNSCSLLSVNNIQQFVFTSQCEYHFITSSCSLVSVNIDFLVLALRTYRHVNVICSFAFVSFLHRCGARLSLHSVSGRSVIWSVLLTQMNFPMAL